MRWVEVRGNPQNWKPAALGDLVEALESRWSMVYGLNGTMRGYLQNLVQHHGLGVNAAVLGLSHGHSRGLSAGANAVAGMPAGLGGFVSANTPGSGSDSGSFFVGAGPNAVPTVVAAGGGLSYTFQVLDRCGR